MTTKIKSFETKYFLESTACNFSVAENKYFLKSKKGSTYSAGMFFGYTDNLPSDNGRFKAQTRVFSEGKKTKAMAIVLFYDEEGKKLQSDYFSANGNNYTVDTEIPTGTKKAEIELIFYCFGDGSAEFSEPEIEIVKENPRRIARIATACIERKGNPKDNMKSVLNILASAGNAEDKPDIICFTEGVHDLGTGKWFFLNEESEEIKAVCQKAKDYSMYVLFTCHEEDEKKFWYNSAFVISPEGKIIGKYRKTHLTLSELKGGLVPGDEFPVFDTPFGKFSILICWDQWFYEASRMIAKKGAEMVFWLTRGYHEERLITRARDNGMYYITSNPTPSKCCIAHPTTGEIIARGKKEGSYVVAEIDLNNRPVSEYKSFGKNGGCDREIFTNEIRPDLYEY